MPTLGEAVVSITANNKNLKSGLRDAERQTERFSKKAERSLKKVDRKLTDIGNSAKRIAKIGGVSFGALSAAIITSVKAATDHEDAMAKLNAAIAGTGKAIDAASLEEYAEHLQNVSTYSNEANIEAMAMLTTFQLTEKEIRSLMPRVQNIAAMYGMDLVQGAKQLGRALTQGAGALSRYGITMSEAQKEAFNMADQQEKVNLLLEIFDKNTGPAAARMANTISGRFHRMMNVLDDLRKEIGRLFDDDAMNTLDTIRVILQTLTDRLSGLDDETKDAIKRWILLAGAFTGVVTAGALLVVALTLIGKTITYTVGLLSLFTSPIFLIIMAIGILATAWINNWGDIREHVQNTYDKYLKPILDWLEEKLILISDLLDGSIEWTIDLVGDAWDWLTGTTMEEKLNDIRRIMNIGWDWFVGVIGDAWDFLKEIKPFDNRVIKSTWEWTIKLAEFLADPTGITSELEDMFPEWNFWEFLDDKTGLKVPWLEGDGQREISLSEQDKKDLALIARLEAGNQSLEGQAAVIEVVLNRVASDLFPDTIEDVIMQSGQFEPADQWEQLRDENIYLADQMEALRLALEDNIIGDAVYFGNLNIIQQRGVSHPLLPGGSGTVTGTIGDHTFGYQAGGMTNGNRSSVAGVVHGGEWVMPAWMVQRFPQLAGMLEGMRQGKGYKDGGQVPGLADARESLNQARQDSDNTFTTIRTVLGNILNGMLDVAREHFEDNELFKAIENFVEDVQTQLGDIQREKDQEESKDEENGEGMPSTFQNIKQAGGELVTSFVEQNAVAKGLAAMLSGNLLGGFMQILKQSAVWGSIIQTLTPLFQDLANIFGIVLLPILKIMTPILKALTGVFEWVAKTLIKIWNGIVSILDAIIFWKSLDKWKASLEDLTEENDKLADSTEEATTEMRNVPSGLKIAEMAFMAATPRPIPSLSVGGMISRSGIAEVHKGEIVANKSQQESLTNAGSKYTFNIGNVYGIDDLDRVIKRSVDKANKQQGLTRRGLNVGGAS